MYSNLHSSNKRNSLLLKKALPRGSGPRARSPGEGGEKTSYLWVAKLERYDTFNAWGKVRNFYLGRTGPRSPGHWEGTGRRSAGSSKGTLTGATGGTGLPLGQFGPVPPVAPVSVPFELPADRRPVPSQCPGDLGPGAALSVQDRNFVPFPKR